MNAWDDNYFVRKVDVVGLWEATADQNLWVAFDMIANGNSSDH